MINLCITAIYDILDPSYGGGARVLGLLKGLSEISEINRIIIVQPFVRASRNGNSRVHTYLSHRSFGSLKAFHKISIVDELNPFRISSLREIVRKFEIDILQNESVWGGLGSALVAKYCDIPFIIDEHNFEAEYTKQVGRSRMIQLYARWLESNVLRSANHVLTVSEEDKRKVSLVYGISPSKTTVIANGVDTSKFHMVTTYERIKAKSELQLSNKFVLVFHGSLDYPPNRDAVSKISGFILPEVVKKIPNAFFLIIGRKPPTISYDNRLLRFTGYVADLAEYLAATDVAVVPILRGGGTKLKILDYLAMGIPIVATKKAVEGLPVENNKHALLSYDVDYEFVRNILALYNNESLREKLSENGRKLAEKYDWKHVSKTLAELYEKLSG
jgi:glycosyltransferase involved in cell wall biosynthesis